MFPFLSVMLTLKRNTLLANTSVIVGWNNFFFYKKRTFILWYHTNYYCRTDIQSAWAVYLKTDLKRCISISYFLFWLHNSTLSVALNAPPAPKPRLLWLVVSGVSVPEEGRRKSVDRRNQNQFTDHFKPIFCVIQSVQLCIVLLGLSQGASQFDSCAQKRGVGGSSPADLCLWTLSGMEHGSNWHAAYVKRRINR